MVSRRDFPDDFIWGNAISAYQTEGGWNADGKSESIWDRFCKQKGAIVDGTNGDVACDSYHRYAEDIALLGDLGAKNFRFSLAWARLLPDGTGPVNARGFDFYKRYMDELAKYGIAPWVTLHHWDIPQALQDKGGWENPDMVHWFTEFCEAVYKNLGDRAQNWIVINEPSTMALMGYATGIHAPGIANEDAYLRAVHTMNRSIHAGYHTLKSLNPSHNVGSSYHIPFIRSNTKDDPAVEIFDALWSRNHLDPLMTGKYPACFAEKFERANKDHMDAPLKTPLDFIGLQYYSPIYTQTPAKGERNAFGAWFDSPPADRDKNALGWEISPGDLKNFIDDFHRRYGKDMPIVLTENGYAGHDTVVNGKVNDQARIQYIEKHLEMLAENKGLVKGYFYWSFLDNFEWADGYQPRFGIIHVDYGTLARQPKESYYWYRNFLGGQL